MKTWLGTKCFECGGKGWFLIGSSLESCKKVDCYVCNGEGYVNEE